MKPDDVARIGCIACMMDGIYTPQVELHHLRINGGKRDNAEIVPLCVQHHRGGQGIHANKKTFYAVYGDPQLLIYITRQMVAEVKERTVGQ